MSTAPTPRRTRPRLLTVGTVAGLVAALVGVAGCGTSGEPADAAGERTIEVRIPDPGTPG
ncbi:hypothetical protein OOK41_18045 [Micromonospora sp. NBC_01655]|uniref:hypothetical protein n=1 Tax=Micromonospora sp. NBC_01655 TaxID=2975983 RepID=UPI0022580381|nr:hypothetical protein [Micromonospora sp. NBC_01655]MCX4472184.1 hypothetical protein [Micromonospora sp. NBC_01655]